MNFLFVASLYHPASADGDLPADFPPAQAEASWTRALRALGHATTVFWRNVDSLAAFRPLAMSQRVSCDRIARALVSSVPELVPRLRRRNRRLVEVARAARPDVVVVIGNNTDILPSTLSRLKHDTGAVVVLACGDSPDVFARRIERAAAPVIDLVVANDATHAEQWRRLGARRAEVLPMSAWDPEMAPAGVLTADERAQWTCEVGFAGTLVPDSLYGRRVAALEALRDFDLAIWSVHEVPASLRRFQRGRLLGPPMLRALSCARVVPNPHGDTMPEGGNLRMFEACGLGTLQIVNECAAASRWFVPGTHLLTYRDPAHLRALVRYYLDHEDARGRVARLGQAHVEMHHTYAHRMGCLVELVEQERRHRMEPQPRRAG